jgi:hypothetical protein
MISEEFVGSGDPAVICDRHRGPAVHLYHFPGPHRECIIAPLRRWLASDVVHLVLCLAIDRETAGDVAKHDNRGLFCRAGVAYSLFRILRGRSCMQVLTGSTLQLWPFAFTLAGVKGSG